jgi:peptidoglycan/LPS O-acetylase OafA/YrhL
VPVIPVVLMPQPISFPRAPESEQVAETRSESRSVSRTSFYRPELDMLRFFAFLAVFRFHFTEGIDRYVESGGRHWIGLVNSLTRAGVFGVDLFFVLSAYLITELLLREKEQFGYLDVRAFYWRRILRIWPLYFFAIGLALFPPLNRQHGFTWRYVAAFLLLAGNWSVVAWGWPLRTIAIPLWTVSIEEQFYLLWPPIVRVLSRFRVLLAAMAMLVLSSAIRVLMVATHRGVFSVWCNSLTRLDPIAAGILIATVLQGGVPRFRLVVRLGMLLAGVAPLVLVANVWRIQGPNSLQWFPTLVGFPLVAAGCALILLAVLGTSVRPPGVLVYLGKISYGLYVYHTLGSFLAEKLDFVRSGLPHLIAREALALSITIVLAAASYRFLESPFLRLKKRFELVRSRPI